MEKLTKQETQTLNFIRQFLEKNERGPIGKEIAVALGVRGDNGKLRSGQWGNRILAALEKKGAIIRKRDPVKKAIPGAVSLMVGV